MADIDAAAVRIDEIRSKGYEAFMIDPILQAATVRYLEIIGEASGELSDRFKAAHPDVPFRKMRGFSSFAKHEYWEIRPDLLWVAVETMPGIRRGLASVRAEDPGRRLRRE
ncbi:MAG TPA: HepT-like ribonuclease domain-containing protein [Thermoplasmata archaeon]|nr:HepT-like ribonuclease domain-containing protein [Thermoplasmata archaeon]